jgi:hypothetical protein
MANTAPTIESKNGSTKSALRAGDTLNGRTVLALPLSKIHWDPAFNGRFAAFTGGVGDAGELYGTAEGIASIRESIKASGQDTPVWVRPVPEGYKGKLPKGAEYLGVAGFRRAAGIAQIVEQAKGDDHPIKADPAWSAKEPTILAVVRADLTDDGDAMLANIRENSARDGFRSPDFVHQVARVIAHYGPEDKRTSVKSIADSTGKVERYVRRASNIARALVVGNEHFKSKAKLDALEPAAARRKIFEHWRAEQFPLSIHEMDALVQNDPPYTAQYESQVKKNHPNAAPAAGSGDANDAPTARDPLAWLGKAREAAAEVGKTVGYLAERATMIAEESGEEREPWSISWDAVTLRGLVKIKKRATDEQVISIAASARRGVAAGRELARAKKEEAEADEGSGEAPVADAAGSAGAK